MEKQRRGFSGIPAKLIHYADAVDYVMKLYILGEPPVPTFT